MYVRGGEQIVRQRQNASNYGESASRSLAQQLRRVKWSNLVSMFRVMSYWQPRAYETLRPGQTDYNKFMSINVDNDVVAFTKEEAASGAVVIEPLVVSQGSLQAVNILVDGGLGLIVSQYGESAPANMGELSARIVRWNPGWQDGDNLAVILFTNDKDTAGIPRATSTYFEFTLDSTSTEAFSANPLTDAMDFQSTQGSVDLNLVQLVNGWVGVVAIHTRQDISGLKVSTERIVMASRDLIVEYSTQTQIDKAVASYGLSSQVPLQPGSSVL